MKTALLVVSICLLVIVDLAAVFILPRLFVGYDNPDGAFIAVLCLATVFVSTLVYIVSVVRASIETEKNK